MKALIVDDEPMPARLLEKLIETHCFEITVVELCFTPTGALELLSNNQYDILFLDVEMPEINGFELLKKLGPIKKTQVIFTTAYSNYAIDAFKANAIHYIMKPIVEEELILAVRKACSQFLQNRNTSKEQDKTISIFQGDEYILIKKNNIIRLEGDGSYTKVVLRSNYYMATHRIGYFEKKLDPSNFIRCHNSHIINKKEIKKINKSGSGYLVLSNDDIVPISKSKKILIENLIV